MQKLVKWLLISEPSQRPDVNEVLGHASVGRRAHLAEAYTRSLQSST